MAVPYTLGCCQAPRGFLCSRFYFAYCEAAFDAKYIHNFQLVWAKSAQPVFELTSSQELSKSLLGGTAAAADPFTQACPLSQLYSSVLVCAGGEREHGTTNAPRCLRTCCFVLPAKRMGKHFRL